MAEIGEWLWLLEAGLAPDHGKHLTVSVLSARNCSLSNRSGKKTLLTRLHWRRCDLPRMGVMEFGLACVLSAAAAEALEQLKPGFGTGGLGLVLFWLWLVDGNELKRGSAVELEPGCSCVLSGATFGNGYGVRSGDEMEMYLECGQSLIPVALYSTLVFLANPFSCTV